MSIENEVEHCEKVRGSKICNLLFQNTVRALNIIPLMSECALLEHDFWCARERPLMLITIRTEYLALRDVTVRKAPTTHRV